MNSRRILVRIRTTPSLTYRRRWSRAFLVIRILPSKRRRSPRWRGHAKPSKSRSIRAQAAMARVIITGVTKARIWCLYRNKIAFPSAPYQTFKILRQTRKIRINRQLFQQSYMRLLGSWIAVRCMRGRRRMLIRRFLWLQSLTYWRSLYCRRKRRSLRRVLTKRRRKTCSHSMLLNSRRKYRLGRF